MTTTYDEIKVYWDTTDPNNEGWAYVAYTGDGEDQKVAESGGLDADDDDLDGAIDEVCHLLDVDLRADQFAREPNIDGGFAIWSAE